MTTCPILETYACRFPPAAVQDTSVTELSLPEHLLRNVPSCWLVPPTQSMPHEVTAAVSSLQMWKQAHPLPLNCSQDTNPIGLRFCQKQSFSCSGTSALLKSQLPRLLDYPAIGQLLHFLLHLHLTLPKLLAGSRETPSGASHVRIGDLKEGACATIW